MFLIYAIDMLYPLVLLVTILSITTSAFLPYSYTIDSMMQRQHAFASQGDGDSKGPSNGSDGNTNGEPTNGGGEGPSDSNDGGASDSSDVGEVGEEEGSDLSPDGCPAGQEPHPHPREQGRCIPICDPPQVYSDRLDQCYWESCADSTESPYLNPLTGLCVSDCAEVGQFWIAQGNMCSLQCPSGYQPQRDTCVKQGAAIQSDDGSGDGDNATTFQTTVAGESNGEENGSPATSGNQNTTQPDGDQCVGDFALDPATGECDPTTGPCPEGETRGESGFCAVMPEECPPGTYIDEDPLCEPCPTEGQIPEECVQPDDVEQPEPEPEPEPEPLTNETTSTNQTGNGNTTFVTINNAIAQAFSSTTYNTRVLQQAAQNTLLIGEETVPLQGLIKANGTRLLSTFDPFKLIGGSATIYLPTSNISSSLSPSTSFLPTSAPDEMQILALDGNNNEVVTLPSTKMSIQGNGFKTVLGEVFAGTNPFTGEQVNVDNIKALFLFNNSNKTITFGYGSSVALLTIVR